MAEGSADGRLRPWERGFLVAFFAGWAVFGVQGDIAGMDVKGTTPCVVILSCTSKSNWLATVSGRVGAVVLDRGLVYVKGGAAWMNTDHTVNTSLIGGGPVTTLTSVNSTAWGWLIRARPAVSMRVFQTYSARCSTSGKRARRSPRLTG